MSEPIRLSTIDPYLEVAISELRSLSPRVRHGDIILRVTRDWGQTVCHVLETSEETLGDIDRVMREKPHKVIEHRGL